MSAEDVDPKKCRGHLCKVRWKANLGEPEHTCPYQAIVNGNDTYKCNCCDTCRQNCQDDT